MKGLNVQKNPEFCASPSGPEHKILSSASVSGFFSICIAAKKGRLLSNLMRIISHKNQSLLLKIKSGSRDQNLLAKMEIHAVTVRIC